MNIRVFEKYHQGDCETGRGEGMKGKINVNDVRLVQGLCFKDVNNFNYYN